MEEQPICFVVRNKIRRGDLTPVWLERHLAFCVCCRKIAAGLYLKVISPVEVQGK